MIFLPLNKKMVENLTKKSKNKGPKLSDKRHMKSKTDSSIVIKGKISHLRANDEMTQALGRSVSDTDLHRARLHAHFYTAASQRGIKKPAPLQKAGLLVPRPRCLIHSNSHSDVLQLKKLADALPDVSSKTRISPTSENEKDSSAEPKTVKKPLTLREKFNARKSRTVVGKN